MKRTSLFFIATLSSQLVVAGGDGNVHVPTHLIFSQIVNFGMLLAILFYFGRDSIKGFFANMRSDYLKFQDEAAAVYAKAQSEKQEIESRLTKLRANKESEITNATVQAEKQKNAMIADGQAMAQQLDKDAQNSFSLKNKKAMDQLRLEIFSKSKLYAEEKLKTEMGSSAQQKWNAGMSSRFRKGVH